MAEPVCIPTNSAQVLPVLQPILGDPDAWSAVTTAGRQTSFLPIDAVLINREKLQNVSDCVSHLCPKSLNLYYAKHIIFPPPFCIHSLVF